MTVVYKSRDVISKLNIKESAFKKYISILEKEGYTVKALQSYI
ncbi:biotin operon repressor [Scopulibacillus daqui]|uniref:Biotin operon repressor n=1 Tax=Scopulibacillus daqui TaxID=1469162 RepID=A0ABS2Q0X4_9BACL|nr:hypothetical protein [Scopulibacillus daqui]MBM7645939.1 biotin operon repressor [Scopulibacillus daqui]